MSVSTTLSFYVTNFQTLFCFVFFSFADTRFGCYSNPEQTTLCCICVRGWGCPAGLQPSGQRCRLDPQGFPLPTSTHLDPSTALQNLCFSALPTSSALSFNHLGCSYFGTICSCSPAKAPTRGSLCRVQCPTRGCWRASAAHSPSTHSLGALWWHTHVHTLTHKLTLTHSPLQELSTCCFQPAVHILGQKPGFCAGFTGTLHNWGPALQWRLLRAIATHVNNNNN